MVSTPPPEIRKIRKINTENTENTESSVFSPEIKWVFHILAGVMTMDVWRICLGISVKNGKPLDSKNADHLHTDKIGLVQAGSLWLNSSKTHALVAFRVRLTHLTIPCPSAVQSQYSEVYTSLHFKTYFTALQRILTHEVHSTSLPLCTAGLSSAHEVLTADTLQI